MPQFKAMRYRTARRIIKNLQNGVSLHMACQAAGLNPSTFWKWRQIPQKKTGILRFGLFIRGILDSRTQLVEDSLYKNALKGNVTAQIFWLKNKAGWKDSPTVLVNANVSAQANSGMTITNLKDTELDELVESIVKKRQG